MRKIAILLLALLAIAGTSAARTHRKSNRVSRSSSHRVRRTAPRVKRATPRYSKRYRTRRSTSYQAPARPPAGPAPERYKEIQQSLADKGYYKGEVNGEWKADSIDALRRFQSDQNLRVDGKIGSLSLIALGLGPKRTSSATAQNKPAQQPTSDPASSSEPADPPALPLQPQPEIPE